MSIYGRGVSLGGGSPRTLPPQIKGFAAFAIDSTIELHWILPEDTRHYVGMVITRKLDSEPQTPNDGVKLMIDYSLTTYTDEGLENGRMYYYRAFPFNSRRQYQTDITDAVANARPNTFQLPQFTGSYAVSGDEMSGSMELYTSGNLLLTRGSYDVFAVGGGGGGGDTRATMGRGIIGGSSGTAVTRLGWDVDYNEMFSVQIGAGVPAGENPHLSGGDSYIQTNSEANIIIAKGATGVVFEDDTAVLSSSGGSGGGMGEDAMLRGFSFGGYGGSDGSDGQDSPIAVGPFTPLAPGHGKGQGSTTRAFGEPDGVLYAAGGGGGVYTNTASDFPDASARGLGGEGGGGDGGYYSTDPATFNGGDGLPNTGSGGGGGQKLALNLVSPSGGGGSGIIIIRWDRNNS